MITKQGTMDIQNEKKAKKKQRIPAPHNFSSDICCPQVLHSHQTYSGEKKVQGWKSSAFFQQKEVTTDEMPMHKSIKQVHCEQGGKKEKLYLSFNE